MSPVETTTRKRKPKSKTALTQENRELKKRLKEAEARAAAKPPDPKVIGPAPSEERSAKEPVHESRTPEEPEQLVSTDAEKPTETEKKELDPGATLPMGVPKFLMDRMTAALKVVGDVQAEVDEFKKHPHYAPGDLPITLHGIQGPGNRLGTRELNYIDERWIDPTIHVHWAEKTMVDYHRGQGYEPFDYDSFMAMVVSRGGNCRFDRDTFGHVAIGDLVLMKTSRDWYEQGQKAQHERNKSREGRAKNLLYSKGEELGVEVDEGDKKGPKLQQIFRLLEDEFGSDKVRRMFLNQ
jgi:hypothetical protein